MAKPYLKLLTDKLESLELQLSNETVLKCKHFFSGAAVYANGNICASLTPVGLGIKLPRKTREKLIHTGAGEELRYFKNAPVKREYVLLSPELVNDPQKLAPLFIQCINHVSGRDPGS